jgi:hypothetical protein
MTMNNAHQSIKQPQRQLLADFLAIVAVGVVLAVPASASAQREAFHGGSSVAAFHIADYIVMRKVAWAGDRVDRPWLHR